MNDIIKTINLIKSSIKTPGEFTENFPKLNSIADNLNTSITEYLNNIKRMTIERIINESISKINWDVLRSKLARDLKNGRTPQKLQWKSGIDKIMNLDIDLFDDDVFMNMYDAYIDINTKDYRNAFCMAIDDIDRIQRELEFVNTSVNKLGSDIVNEIMTSGIDMLYEEHYSYVSMIKNKYNKIPEYNTINGIDVPYKKSQNEYIISAIKILNQPSHI